MSTETPIPTDDATRLQKAHEIARRAHPDLPEDDERLAVATAKAYQSMGGSTEQAHGWLLGRIFRRLFAKGAAHVRGPEPSGGYRGGPGSHGGKGYWDDKGQWQYGERPAGLRSHQPFRVVAHDAHGTPRSGVRFASGPEAAHREATQVHAREGHTVGSVEPIAPQHWAHEQRGTIGRHLRSGAAAQDIPGFARKGERLHVHEMPHPYTGHALATDAGDLMPVPPNHAHRLVPPEKAEAEATERQQKETERKASIDAEVKAAKWSKGSVKIPQEDGTTKDVTGPSIGGLMVQQHGSGKNLGYGVTHVGSGRIVISGQAKFSQAQAKVAAYRLSKEHDWTQSADELSKHGKQLSQLVSALKSDPYNEFPGEQSGRADNEQRIGSQKYVEGKDYHFLALKNGKIRVMSPDLGKVLTADLTDGMIQAENMSGAERNKYEHVVRQILPHVRALKDSGADPTEMKFLRYVRRGDAPLPPGGRSRNVRTGKAELGVSVYLARWTPTSGEFIPEDFQGRRTGSAAQDKGLDAYLVQGRIVGRGSDGEPLLDDVHVAVQLTPSYPHRLADRMNAHSPADRGGIQKAATACKKYSVTPWGEILVKADTPEEKAELIAEHKRLVKVLRSASRTDDKTEAKTQAAELAGYRSDTDEDDDDADEKKPPASKPQAAWAGLPPEVV